MPIEIVTDPNTLEPITPVNQAKHLAVLLGSIASLKQEKAEYLAEWKLRSDRLQLAAAKLANEILSGQMTLIPDEEPKP
jgi:hypothetical protein